MKRKILAFFVLLSGIAVILTSLLITAAAYRDFFGAIQKEVVAQSSYIQSGVELMGMDYLQSIEHQAGHRLTLIAPDGEVLFDTVGDLESMDNHLSRPEVQSALSSGAGESTRYSDTLREKTYYYAVLLDDGSVLRMSSTTKSLAASYDNLFGLVSLIAVGVFAAAFAIAHFMTKRIVRPINELDLDYPEGNTVYEELTPLLKRMKSQNDQIKRQIRALGRQRAEFSSITENMSEGFLVLDKEAHILSYNKSALRLLDAPSGKFAGQNVLVLNRSEVFRDAVKAATGGTEQECIMETGGRYFQLLASPVMESALVNGAVLVLMDITERHEREELRREFTANVSHELKTPLTAISGYSEIIMNGLARTDDIPAFSKNIYEEAQRLIALVRDLMLLSKLDENNVPPLMEQVNLLERCQAAQERLLSQAKARGISVSVSGEPAEITGSLSILDEMIYNLLDNAVKYNRNGGWVGAKVEKAGEEVVLSISDNGIGIPKADKERVFERFYRGDKSHSKGVLGTGLGLAIVKHGAALHGAKIELESIADIGTTVKLFFPPSEQ